MSEHVYWLYSFLGPLLVVPLIGLVAFYIDACIEGKRARDTLRKQQERDTQIFIDTTTDLNAKINDVEKLERNLEQRNRQ